MFYLKEIEKKRENDGRRQMRHKIYPSALMKESDTKPLSNELMK